MNAVPYGVGTCAIACISICGTGCLSCFIDGPIFVADTATGGAALASGLTAGATK